MEITGKQELMTVYGFMTRAEPHINIVNAFAKAWDVLGRYTKPACSVSGGSDSDIMLDLLTCLDEERKIRYVWFNTGLEYSATKKHLEFLEGKYGITIERRQPVMPVVLTVAEHGVPFLSKHVSQQISSLQRHGFDFSTERSFDEDVERYSGSRGALGWWHNTHSYKTWNVSRHKHLKEFLSMYPPQFKISDKCCEYTKKKTSKLFLDQTNSDLNIIGTRKAEGGIRQAQNNCFTYSEKSGAIYRPLFWFTDEDKGAYSRIFGVTHSECYTLYGLKRTGCAGCPFNPNVFRDMERVKDYEAGLVKASECLFGKSYEYTRKYREFVRQKEDTTLNLPFEEVNDEGKTD